MKFQHIHLWKSFWELLCFCRRCIRNEKKKIFESDKGKPVKKKYWVQQYHREQGHIMCGSTSALLHWRKMDDLAWILSPTGILGNFFLSLSSSVCKLVDCTIRENLNIIVSSVSSFYNKYSWKLISNSGLSRSKIQVISS